MRPSQRRHVAITHTGATVARATVPRVNHEPSSDGIRLSGIWIPVRRHGRRRIVKEDILRTERNGKRDGDE